MSGSLSLSQGQISMQSVTVSQDPFFNDVVLLTGFNGNFNDESNLNHTPTVVGGVSVSPTDAYFPANSVGQFPASGIDSDYVEYPISSDFRLEMTEDWTIELFFRLSALTNEYRTPLWFWDNSTLTIDVGVAGTQRGFGFIIQRTGGPGGPIFSFRYISADVVRYTIAGPTISANTWYYAAVVNDGATRTATLYLNNSTIGTGVGTANGLGSDMVCSIGRTKTEFANFERDWGGQIEEVRVTRAKRTISGIPTEPFPRS